jgi:hypothetical protein
MSNRYTGFDSRYNYPVDLLFGFSKEELQAELKKGDPTDNMWNGFTSNTTIERSRWEI